MYVTLYPPHLEIDNMQHENVGYYRTIMYVTQINLTSIFS